LLHCTCKPLVQTLTVTLLPRSFIPWLYPCSNKYLAEMGRMGLFINLQPLVGIMRLDRDISFEASHDPARSRDRDVLALKEKVQLVGSAELSKTKTTQAIVEVTLARPQGRARSTVVRHHTRAVLGSATRPMDRADLERKCHPLLEPALGARRATSLIDAIWTIDRLPDVRALRRLLSRP
ncbi:MAG: hypothetical protein ACK5WE_15380, partial [bacterium]